VFTTVQQLAAALDFTLLNPQLTAAYVKRQLEAAKSRGLGCAVVRPCEVDVATRALDGSPVRPGSVAGFPHGSQTTSAKLYEIRDLLRRGAREIHMVIALPKLLSHEFEYVQTELDQAADACRRQDAVLKVIFESAWLTEEMKIEACRRCARAGVDFAATGTDFSPSGYSPEDVQFMRKRLPEEIGVEASGGVLTLDQVFEACTAGASRFASSAALEILDEWEARLAAPES
jgi:deoxyribose-phosphate aldolase